MLQFFPALLLPRLPNAGIRAQRGQDEVEAASAKTWVGKKAKGFTPPGTDGKSVDVAKNLGKRPIALVPDGRKYTSSSFNCVSLL